MYKYFVSSSFEMINLSLFCDGYYFLYYRITNHLNKSDCLFCCFTIFRDLIIIICFYCYKIINFFVNYSTNIYIYF